MLISMVAIYIVLEFLLIPHLKLASDELWFAHHIYQYLNQIPYKDFPPYKTVLGYYLFSLPFFFSHHILNTLFYVKDEIVLLNAFFFLLIGYYGLRFFSPSALITTLGVIICSFLFPVYSSDLRVDLLATWFGVVAVLFIFYRRFWVSGLCLGISFLISQKAAWFLIATNGALFIPLLMNTSRLQIFKKIIVINVSTLAVIFIYCLMWSLISSPSIVFNSVFYEAYTQSKITWYCYIYYFAWQKILSNGPLLILLWPVTFILFFTHHDKADGILPGISTRLFILIYSFILISLLLTYQQPFPYNIVLGLPAFYILYAEFLTWLESKDLSHRLSPRVSFWFFSLCSISIIGSVFFFGLPLAFILIAAIPIGIYFFKKEENTSIQIIWITIFLTGFLFPLARFTIIALELNNTYQKNMLIVADQLLNDGGFYIGGSPFLFNKEQGVLGLKNLIGPAIDYLYKPSDDLEPIMLSSLDLDKRKMEQVIDDIKNQPVKLYINNVRLLSLPDSILQCLHQQFIHYWGSIYLYAPLVTKGTQKIKIHFSGRYFIKAKSDIKLSIDGNINSANSIVTLKKGFHQSLSNQPYRLQLQPNITLNYSTDSEIDDWDAMFKPILR